jgi:hypothetical protein
MQIQLQKVYQLLLTAAGLAMLAIVMALNHYHPHNQGIADITKTFIYNRLGINTADSTGPSGLGYVSTLPVAPQDKTKITQDNPANTDDNASNQTPQEDSQPANSSDQQVEIQDPAKVNSSNKTNDKEKPSQQTKQ